MTTAAASTASGSSIVRSLVRGAVAGVVASMAMAMVAMFVSTAIKHTGFFTPLYHIGATFCGPDAMMQSAHAAMAGDSFTFIWGPAVVGAMIHMMVGAMYGAMFAVLAQMARLHGAVLIGAAMMWGLVVFAISSWIGLPIAAALFGGGDTVSNMAQIVGYGPFAIEHLMYGAALGLALLRPAKTR
ncbi:hypothetical protein [Pseudomonas otitidis]